MLELIHKALFALISGFSEMVFASPAAHQLLYRTFTGYELADPLASFGIHLGCLIALLVNCQKKIKQLRYEKRLGRSGRRSRGRQSDLSSLLDIRILNTAVVPLLLAYLFYRRTSGWISTPLMALLLFVNGAILFLPCLFRAI